MKLWISAWVAGGVLISAASADLLDDGGVHPVAFASIYRFRDQDMPGQGYPSLAGVPISEAHAAEISAELSRLSGPALAAFLESRGDFSKALEIEDLNPLDRVRLLLRAGRSGEAGAVMDGEDFRKLTSSNRIGIAEACRPLEDAGAWDELDAFLRLLSGRLDSPEWRAAIWSEELDIAWHLDRLQPLLAASADSPLRLAFFHQQLGNQQEQDRLIAGLLETAGAGQVIELLTLFRSSAAVRQAGLGLWKRKDLSTDERLALFNDFGRNPGTGDFEDAFRAWLPEGDALPLKEAIVRLWSVPQTYAQRRAPVLEALIRRHPDEPWFQLLLAREIMRPDPARATELLTRIVVLPLSPAPNGKPLDWESNPAWITGGPAENDLPMLALDGLGRLERQDLALPLLERHPEWPGLSARDQARYLMAARMDFPLMRRMMEADYQNPANDTLPSLLVPYFNARSTGHRVPQELVTWIVENFDRFMAGSPTKNPEQVTRDASEMFSYSGLFSREDVGIDLEVLKKSVARLEAMIATRDRAQAGKPSASLRSTAANPRLKNLFPAEKAQASSPRAADAIRQTIPNAMKAMTAIQLVGQPEILRIRPHWAGIPNGYGDGGHNSGMSGIPLLDLLRGGAEALFSRRLNLPSKDDKESQAMLCSLLRGLAADDPRRLRVEVLIARNMVDCGDETLKAQALRNVAELIAGDREKRGNELFRFVALVQQGADDNQLRKVLAEVKIQPPSVRDRFLASISPGIGLSRNALALARTEVRGTEPEPTPAHSPPENDADLEKLAELRGRNLGATPEAVALAERTLDKALMEEPNQLSERANGLPVSVLEATGTLDAWLAGASEKLTAAGLSKVEIQRRLLQLDADRSDDARAHLIRRATEILKLDPTDTDSARLLVNEGASKASRELLLSCVRALKIGGLIGLSLGDAQLLFGKSDAAEVLSLIRSWNPGSADFLPDIHRYFLDADPKLAAEFRGWLGERGDTPKSGWRKIAEQLLQAGEVDEAADILARTFVTSPAYPGFPHQFPPRKSTPVANTGNSDLSSLKNDLEFLRNWNVLSAVVARMEALGGVDPLALATFQMAARPDAATFERVTLPAIANLRDTERAGVIQGWINILKMQPGTSTVVLRLLGEQARSAQSASNHGNVIKAASQFDGSAQLIAEQWSRLETSLEKSPPQEKESVRRIMRSVAPEMLIAAADGTWKRYWKFREADPMPLEKFSFLPDSGLPSFIGLPLDSVSPSRLRPPLARLLDDSKDRLPARYAETFSQVAVTTGDKELIKRVRAALPPENPFAAEFCDLALGKTAAISPSLGAVADENGKTLLWWDFVRIPPSEEIVELRIPWNPFPALDGKCEVTITAGTLPDRQEVIWKKTAAPAAGHVRLKLAADQHFVAMSVTDPRSGIVRWTTPIDLRQWRGQPISPEVLQRKGFKPLKQAGPGGLPAWKIRLSGSLERVDLLDVPWTGSERVDLGGWIGGEGKMMLRCLNTEGGEIAVLELATRRLLTKDSWLTDWEFHTLSTSDSKVRIPIGTARLMLSASASGLGNGPPDLAISNFRMEVGPPAPLPANTERIARLPGPATALAISPDGGQLAAVLSSGKLVIADIASGTTREIPIRSSPRGHPPRVTHVVWGNSGPWLILEDGYLYHTDERFSGLEIVMQPARLGPSYGKRVVISPDGHWLAMGTSGELALIAIDGITRRDLGGARSFTVDDRGFHWTDSEGRRLVLKTGEFAKGEPQQDPDPPSDPRPGVSGKPENTVAGSDGSFFYVDDSCFLVRLKP